MGQILTLIEEYYSMKDGEFIQNHNSFFVIYDDEIEVRLKYKTIKHIVESRKRDGYDMENIKMLFHRVYDFLSTKKYNIVESKENNSYLLIENDVRYRALVIALDIHIEDDSLHIKTAFFRAVTKTDKIKNPLK